MEACLPFSTFFCGIADSRFQIEDSLCVPVYRLVSIRDLSSSIWNPLHHRPSGAVVMVSAVVMVVEVDVDRFQGQVNHMGMAMCVPDLHGRPGHVVMPGR